MSISCLCVCVCAGLTLRKGPVERVSFPSTASTVSPYQQLGQYIMILGQKIDSARDLKACFVCFT